MTQRLLADPAAASAVPGDPTPCVALNRPAVGKQAMSGDAGAHDQQTARRAGACSDERRIAVAHRARSRKGGTGGQEVLAAVDIRTRRADRKDDPSELVISSADRRAALAPEIDDAPNRPLEIRRGIAWTRRRLGERSPLRVEKAASAASAASVHTEIELAVSRLLRCQAITVFHARPPSLR